MFFSYRHSLHLHLHSFPTRRSSDLVTHRAVLRHHDCCWRSDVIDERPTDPVAVEIGYPDQVGGYIGNGPVAAGIRRLPVDRKSTRLNSSHLVISYAVFCLKKKKVQT